MDAIDLLFLLSLRLKCSLFSRSIDSLSFLTYLLLLHIFSSTLYV